MFETDLKMDEEGMTVPYPPLFDGVRKNHGFIDVRGRPDLASSITEGARSPAMKHLLIALAEPGSKVFTIGCDLGTKILEGAKFPHTAGGYLQIMDEGYAQRSPEDYARFSQAVAQMLKTTCSDHEWQVYFVLKPVRFKLDNYTDMTGSLWIWFHAFADDAKKALASREVLVSALHKALTDERHIQLFDS